MKNFEVRIYSPENLNERWYVYIYDTIKQKPTQKFYKGINSVFDYQDRMIRCEVLKDSLIKELKSGWIPKSEKKLLPQPEDLGFKIIEAFDFAFEIFKTKLAKKTLQDYSSVYKFLKAEIIALKWQIHDIKDFDTYHIKILLEETQKRQNWSNKRYNKASNVLRSIFTVLKKEFIVKNNPAQGLDYLPEEESEPINLITPEEQTQIINHFKFVCPNFNVFLKIIYQCGIRPGEIIKIKCSMIDLNKKIFRLPKEITKARKRNVPISEDLKNDLSKFDFSEPNNFLFGIYSPYCRRNDKKFVVSEFPLSINVAGNLWRENVHDILHIYKKMYWFKHKGANDKEEQGMEIKTVQQIFGHSSEKITEIYATKHEEKQFEIARALMPKFI